jgi:hypothetical protein
MTSDGFLSVASVVMVLAGVGLLAVALAFTLAPLNRFERPRGMVVLVFLAGIWAVAVLVIVLIRRTI